MFLFNEMGYLDKHGSVNIGASRFKLLGILYAGPQHTASGEIRIVMVPTNNKAIAITGIPNNIGIVIKAEKLFELNAIFDKMVTDNGEI